MHRDFGDELCGGSVRSASPTPYDPGAFRLHRVAIWRSTGRDGAEPCDCGRLTASDDVHPRGQRQKQTRDDDAHVRRAGRALQHGRALTAVPGREEGRPRGREPGQRGRVRGADVRHLQARRGLGAAEPELQRGAAGRRARAPRRRGASHRRCHRPRVQAVPRPQ
ncbi:hypothetical protein ANO14919_058750 [Xylariales sp. No.14919]|nr:hypothetical protein ANO14919_058750 [Xylariales sp. No.14919]